MNLFVSPQDKQFSVPINFYDIHHAFIHYVGASDDSTNDMRAVIKLIEEKKVQAAKVVAHILGLSAASEVTLELSQAGGGRKLVYTRKSLPLTALAQTDDPALRAILERHQGIWSQEAEQYVLFRAEEVQHDQP